MAASIDPTGQNGGPVLQTLVLNRSSLFGKLTYTTMPEQLQARGISWTVYTSPDQDIVNSIFSDNVLSYFKNFQDPNSSLYKNAFLPQFPTDFLSDALTGNLPQVSWVIASVVDSDHPPAPSLFGEDTLSSMISVLSMNPAQSAKTVIFVTYDENGGFFDHVAPVTAPRAHPANTSLRPQSRIPRWLAPRRFLDPSAWVSVCRCL
jgi:phospholipase C